MQCSDVVRYLLSSSNFLFYGSEGIATGGDVGSGFRFEFGLGSVSVGGSVAVEAGPGGLGVEPLAGDVITRQHWGRSLFRGRRRLQRHARLGPLAGAACCCAGRGIDSGLGSWCGYRLGSGEEPAVLRRLLQALLRCIQPASGADCGTC